MIRKWYYVPWSMEHGVPVLQYNCTMYMDLVLPYYASKVILGARRIYVSQQILLSSTQYSACTIGTKNLGKICQKGVARVVFWRWVARLKNTTLSLEGRKSVQVVQYPL